MPRRRDVLALGAASATWPILARAQAAIPRVGYVWIGAKATDQNVAGLRQGFLDRGYEIGRNLALEERYADGEADRVPALISDLLALNVSVLVTPGTPITLAAHRATKTVPIVCVTADPVGNGLAESLSKPGGNITGLSLLSADYSAKWPQLLKEVVPKLTRIAALWNPDNPSGARELDHMREAAQALGFELVAFSMKPVDAEASLSSIAAGNFDGMVLITDASLEPLTSRIAAFASDHRMPAVYPFSEAVQQGGLMSYSADFFALWRGVASYVDRILRGERPSDLPIEQATAVVLKVNLKTAKAMGLNLPPTLLATADEVIE